MLNKNNLRKEICPVCPEGLYHNMSVDFDSDVGAWVVDFDIHNKHLRTYLEESDAKACTDQHHCFAVGLQLGEVVRDLNTH